MRVSTLLLATLSLSITSTSAQGAELQQKALQFLTKVTEIRYLLGYGQPLEKEKIDFTPGLVHSIDIVNWKNVLQDTDVNWLLLFTTSEENCPGCVAYDKVFNDTVAILHDQSNTHFARVDCDAQALLCAIFGSWGARAYHITHDIVPSKSFPGMTVRKTMLHAVPFQRPGSEGPPIIDEKGKEKRAPPPPPDVDWVVEVLNEGKWKDFEEWDDTSQPFEGLFKEALYVWWWIVNLFNGVPPMAAMIGIGLLSRYVTGRYTNRALAPKPRPQPAVAAATKKNK